MKMKIKKSQNGDPYFSCIYNAGKLYIDTQ